MRKVKRRQRPSLPFRLFLAVVGALLLPAAVAPRANAANFSWTGFTAAGWNNPGNWSPGGGPPGPGDTALFNGAFIFQPNLTTGVTVGTLHMTTVSFKTSRSLPTPARSSTSVASVFSVPAFWSITPMLSR